MFPAAHILCTYWVTAQLKLVTAKIVIAEMFLKQSVVFDSKSCPLMGPQTLYVCDISGFCNCRCTCTVTNYTQRMNRMAYDMIHNFTYC